MHRPHQCEGASQTLLGMAFCGGVIDSTGRSNFYHTGRDSRDFDYALDKFMGQFRMETSKLPGELLDNAAIESPSRSGEVK